ncbi:cyclophilin-like fold protein [Streptococcus constellatus]|nr:cyclophilin-like fold protein [Streptococcus constellatus]
MKLVKAILLASVLTLLTACSSQGNQEQTSSVSESQVSSQTSSRNNPSTQEEEATMQLTINGQIITVDWADNPTVTALYNQVKNQPIEIKVRDYASMEKVGKLPETLPSSNEQISTDAGDITLYNGRDLAFYYNPNNYSLTPIGKIQGMSKDEIRRLLTSQKEMTVRFSSTD